MASNMSYHLRVWKLFDTMLIAFGATRFIVGMPSPPPASPSRLRALGESCRLAVATALTAALSGGFGAAASQVADQPYAGKQVRMVIAAGAGGGYDVYARTLAMHIGRHIPGSPSIINQNMPIAAGMQATNWAYAVAPRDGTVILATFNSLLTEPLYGNPAALYDPLKFAFVGS